MKNKNRSFRTAGFLALLILILLGVRIIFYVQQQYVESLWNGKNNFSIFFYGGKKPFLAYFDVLKEKIYLLKFPVNRKLKYDFLSGEYDYFGILKLGEIDGKKAQYMKFAAGYFYRAPILAVLENKNMSRDSFDLKLMDVIGRQTDLTIFDYLRIKKNRFSLKMSELNDVDFQDLSLAKLYYLVKFEGKVSSEENLFFQDVLSYCGFKLSAIDLAKRMNVPRRTCVFKKQSEFDDLLKKIFFCELEYDSSLADDLIIQFAGRETP